MPALPGGQSSYPAGMGFPSCAYLTHSKWWNAQQVPQVHGGCGAWHNTSWFQVPWDNRAGNLSIAAKELVPIILACAAWGRSWHACQVRCNYDNQVVVAALRSRSSRDQGVMHLLRCLVFVEAQIGCQLWGIYINTHSNHLADDLS